MLLLVVCFNDSNEYLKKRSKRTVVKIQQIYTYHFRLFYFIWLLFVLWIDSVGNEEESKKLKSKKWPRANCVFIGWKKVGPSWKLQKKSLHVCALIVGESNRIKSISMIALAGCFTARNWKWNFIQQLMWICHKTLFFAMRTDAVPVQIKFCFDSFPFRVENHKCVFQFADAIQKNCMNFFVRGVAFNKFPL